MRQFQIEIENLGLGGLCKQYWKSDYATFGNRNQANAMRNMDLRNPNNIIPGPSRQRLTNGDESGVIGTLMLRIMSRAFAANETYGVAGRNIMKLTSSVVSVDHAITDFSQVNGKDIIEYGNKLYYVFDHSTHATLGMRDAALAYDDDFMERGAGATTGTFQLTLNVPHKLLVGGDDILYITNGNKVSSYDDYLDVGVEDVGLDLPTDVVITDMEWNNKKLILTTDWPNLTGDNRTIQRIFIWNTVDEWWDDDVPQVRRSGALYTKEGITFVFYEDITSDGGGRLGYFDGSVIKELAQFNGTLPKFYQVDEKDGFICWVSRVGSEDLIFCWGSGDPSFPARTFQIMKGKYNTIGAIGLPFGSLIVASENESSGADNLRADLSREAGYDSDSYFYGMDYPISLDERNAVIRKLTVDFEQLKVGAETVLKLRNSAGTEFFRKTLSYDRVGRKTKKIYLMSKRAEDCRLEIDNTNGFSSTTTIAIIKKIILSGYSVR